MSSHRVLGLLAATFGDTEAAATHFEDSLAFAEKAGYVRETVWTQMEYAEVLLDRDEPGDREKAIELQDEALAITQELGDAAAHRTHPGTAGDLAGVEFRMVVLIGHRGIGIPGGLGPHTAVLTRALVVKTLMRI